MNSTIMFKAKCFVFLISFLVGLNIYAQNSEKELPATIRINDILSVSQFEKVRDYIISKGERKVFCATTGKCPFMQVDGTMTDVYLVSFSAKSNPAVSDYTVMYIVPDYSQMTRLLYVYMTEQGNVYLYDFNDTWRNSSQKELALKKLRVEVQKIEMFIK